MRLEFKKVGLAVALFVLAGTTAAKEVTLAFVAASMQYPHDVAVAFTTSGSSRNVVVALAEARRRGIATVAFTGVF